MPTFLPLLIPGMLWILFFRFAVKSGNLLAFLGHIDLPEFVKKPLWGCTVCMASAHGLLMFLGLGLLGFHDYGLAYVLLYCPCLSGAMVAYHSFEKKSLW